MIAAAPDPAATVVLLSEATPPEIFFVRRAAASAFMPNAWVFPGGRLDVLDRDPRALERLGGVDVAALAARMHGVDDLESAAALVVCGLRETFEEAGILLVDPPAPAGALVAELARARQALLRGDLSFPSLLKSLDLRLDGAALSYFDHWITPPIERRRFDTRFFVARAPAGQLPRHDACETTDSAWLSAPAALARHGVAELGLAPPTFWILGELAAHATASEVQTWAAGRDVPAVRPTVVTVDGALGIALPGDPLYPGQPDGDVAPRRVVWNGRSWARG